MPESVLDAIKNGQWDYEPAGVTADHYNSTGALPGTGAKLDILAQRAQRGLPLWHPEDRQTYDDSENGLD